MATDVLGTHAEGLRLPPSFEAVFRQVYVERFDGLCRYLDRLTGDPDLATEIGQETFVRLYKRGTMPDDVGGWIVAVANNLRRDEGRRSQRRRRLLASRSPDATLADQTPAPDADLVPEERRRMVRLALDRLPLMYRQLLLLRHSGFSYREIAAGLDIAEVSVGTLLARATASFRQAFVGTHGALD